MNIRSKKNENATHENKNQTKSKKRKKTKKNEPHHGEEKWVVATVYPWVTQVAPRSHPTGAIQRQVRGHAPTPAQAPPPGPSAGPAVVQVANPRRAPPMTQCLHQACPSDFPCVLCMFRPLTPPHEFHPSPSSQNQSQLSVARDAVHATVRATAPTASATRSSHSDATSVQAVAYAAATFQSPPISASPASNVPVHHPSRIPPGSNPRASISGGAMVRKPAVPSAAAYPYRNATAVPGPSGPAAPPKIADTTPNPGTQSHLVSLDYYRMRANKVMKLTVSASNAISSQNDPNHASGTSIGNSAAASAASTAVGPRNSVIRTAASSASRTSINVAFFNACIDDNLENVRQFVAEGADLFCRDSRNRSALHYAAINNSLDVAAVLISNGVPIDAQDACQFTPLHFAAYYNQNAMLKLLINGGAHVDVRNRDGRTSLILVLEETDNVEGTEALLAAGADPNTFDDFGQTSLHYAASYGREQCVRALLQAGADAALCNIDGQTAKEVAKNSHIYSLFP